MNTFFDNILKKTLWIWLPFWALNALIREVLNKK